jgi:hypothetical protein
MKLYFVNVECRVRKESRTISAKECAEKPYRTFTYVVVAATERDALNAEKSYESECWYEVKRYVQSREGISAGEPIFIGASDHASKRYATECEEAHAR